MPKIFLMLLLSVSTAFADETDQLIDAILSERLKQPQPRTINGYNNNLKHKKWGMAGTRLLRTARPSYSDGISSPAGKNRPSARQISNSIHKAEDVVDHRRASDFVWLWGQFIDHDLDLTTENGEEEPFHIRVPKCDSFFDPKCTGYQRIRLFRSIFDPHTGHGKHRPREQINLITSYIDASNVYGSNHRRAKALRTLDGTGRLKQTPGGFPHYNKARLPNAPNNSPRFFLAGDIRANENVALTALHALFVREHNFWARLIKKHRPKSSGRYIYELARAIVGAELQIITYKEFLPALMGKHAPGTRSKYKPDQNAAISNEFSTVAFRFGHSMVSETLLRFRSDGSPIKKGHLPLRKAFFAPERLVKDGGVEPLFRGLVRQVAQKVDPFITDSLRNFLFGKPTRGGFDLASLNIQRGRDHGMAHYNQLRRDFALKPKHHFADITPDVHLRRALRKLYKTVNNIDPWVGVLAEPVPHHSSVGETVAIILRSQFQRVRDGDRFWYTRYFDKKSADLLEKQTLQKIIVRNTRIREHELPRNVFFAKKH